MIDFFEKILEFFFFFLFCNLESYVEIKSFLALAYLSIVQALSRSKIKSRTTFFFFILHLIRKHLALNPVILHNISSWTSLLRINLKHFPQQISHLRTQIDQLLVIKVYYLVESPRSEHFFHFFQLSFSFFFLPEILYRMSLEDEHVENYTERPDVYFFVIGFVEDHLRGHVSVTTELTLQLFLIFSFLRSHEVYYFQRSEIRVFLRKNYILRLDTSVHKTFRVYKTESRSYLINNSHDFFDSQAIFIDYTAVQDLNQAHAFQFFKNQIINQHLASYFNIPWSFCKMCHIILSHIFKIFDRRINIRMSYYPMKFYFVLDHLFSELFLVVFLELLYQEEFVHCVRFFRFYEQEVEKLTLVFYVWKFTAWVKDYFISSAEILFA